MMKFPWPALFVLTLALGISACAGSPRAQNPEQLAVSTPTTETLPGGLLPAPGSAQKAAPPTATVFQQPSLPPLPTLVPTITLPTALPTLAPVTPTATQAAPRLDPACLVGTWQVVDLQEAMRGSLAQSGSSLALERVDGQAVYVFGADGGMSLTYRRLAAVLSGTVENRAVNAVQTLDGTATARYAVDGAAGTIEMSAFGGEGIRSALEINGQTLAEGSLPVWLAFTRGQTQPEAGASAVQSSRAAAACAGSTLTLQAVEPVPGPPLRLERVEE